MIPVVRCLPLFLALAVPLQTLPALAQSPQEVSQEAIEAYRAGNYAAAAEAWQQLIELEPGNPNAHNNLGATLYYLGDLEGAVAAYQAAIALSPDATTYNNLGVVLAEQEDFEAAIAAYEQALELDPEVAEVYVNLGHLLNPNDAIALYERAIELQPDYVEAYNSLGIALVSLEQYEAAIAAFEQTLAIDPTHEAAQDNLTALQEQLESVTE